MALSPFQKHPADVGELHAQAAKLEQLGSQCLDQSKITDSAYKSVVENWDGMCAAELRVAPESVRADARTASAQLAWAAVPLRYVARMVTEFNQAAAKAEAASQHVPAATVEAAKNADAPGGDGGGAGMLAAARADARRAAVVQYERAYEEYIRGGFGDAAAMFKKGPTTPNISIAADAGAIPSTAAYKVFGALWRDDAAHPTEAAERKLATEYRPILAVMTPEERRDYILRDKNLSGPVLDMLLKDDRETADLVGNYLADKAGDLDPYTRDSFTKLNKLLERFQQSHEVSASMLASMGGTKLLSAFAQSHIGPAERDKTELRSLLRSMLRSGEPTLGTQDPATTRKLAKDLAKAFPLAHSDIPNLSEPGDLAYLLRDSKLSTPFLDTMGDELDHYERDSRAFDDPAKWPDLSSPDGDPADAFMSALGRNDEAALQFFNAGGENPYHAKPSDPENETPSDREEYWIKDRQWNDKFDSLMSALDAATTGEHNLQNTANANAAAELMSWSAHLLAERHGNDAFAPGDVSSHGTEHMAHMLSTYMSAIDSSLGSSYAHPHPGTQILTGDRFSRESAPILVPDDLRHLANVAVSSDHGLEAMRNGLNAYQSAQLARSIEAHGRPDEETWRADARLEGFFVNAVGDTKIADAADDDARVRAWIDLGKSAAGAVPLPGGATAAALASSALKGAGDSLAEQYATHQRHEVDDSNSYADAAQTQRINTFEQALVNRGVIAPSEISDLLKGNHYSEEQVRSWFGPGESPQIARYPSPWVGKLSADDWTNLNNALDTIVDKRQLMDRDRYHELYDDAFHRYFRKGDGAGN